MLVRLRLARREARLTQAEVAAHLGRRQPFVSKCESGERRIDPTQLARFAHLYAKPLSFFLEEAPGMVARELDPPAEAGALCRESPVGQARS